MQTAKDIELLGKLGTEKREASCYSTFRLLYGVYPDDMKALVKEELTKRMARWASYLQSVQQRGRV